jgi:hypothetical protein
MEKRKLMRTTIGYFAECNLQQLPKGGNPTTPSFPHTKIIQFRSYMIFSFLRLIGWKVDERIPFD